MTETLNHYKISMKIIQQYTKPAEAHACPFIIMAGAFIPLSGWDPGSHRRPLATPRVSALSPPADIRTWEDSDDFYYSLLYVWTERQGGIKMQSYHAKQVIRKEGVRVPVLVCGGWVYMSSSAWLCHSLAWMQRTSVGLPTLGHWERSKLTLLLL